MISNVGAFPLPANAVKLKPHQLLHIEVRTGLHTGASHVLPERDIVVLGRARDCDLVLLDDGIAPRHCLLTRVHGQLGLRCLEGEVFYQGKKFASGDSVLLLTEGELQISGISVWVGGIKKRSRIAKHIKVAGKWYLLSVALFSAAAYATVSGWSGPTGIAEIAEKQPSSVPVNSGAANKSPESDGANIASSVKEVFRLSGLKSETRYLGEGRVEVSGYFGASTALPDIIQSRAMRDIRELKQVVLLDRSRHPPKEAKKQKILPLDASRKIASIVSGKDPYLVTADDSRFYPGATLPDGSRLLAMEPNHITLKSKSGEQHIVAADKLFSFLNGANPK